MMSTKLGPIEPKGPTAGQWWLTLVLITLTVGIAIGFYRAMTTPSELATAARKPETLTCSTDFSYRVMPIKSTLYPDGRDLTTGPRFFTLVTDDIEVAFHTLIQANPEHRLAGFYRVDLVIQAGDLWQKEYTVKPDSPFEGQDGTAEISGTYSFNLQERLAFIDRVEEETGVWPTDGYRIYLQPSFAPELTDSTGSLQQHPEGPVEYIPQFGFDFRSLQFMPYESPEQNMVFTFSHDETGEMVPALLTVAGISAEVGTARVFLGILLAVFTLLCLRSIVILARAATRGTSMVVGLNRQSSDPIGRKYHRRLVKAQRIEGITLDRPTVEVSSFSDLLRVADESEQPIISVENRRRPQQPSPCYYVLAGENAYVYSVGTMGEVRNSLRKNAPPSRSETKEAIRGSW